MLQDNLIEAALQFRNTKLWEVLQDSNLFAVKVSSGEMVYCSVMGNISDEYSLGMYKGDEGLRSYYDTVSVSSFDYYNVLSVKSTFDYVICMYSNAKDMIFPQEKEHIKQVAKERGLKICRSQGYFDFLRHRPLKIEGSVSDPQEQQWAMESLQGAVFMAKALKGKSIEELGFNDNGGYFPENGGAVVPLVTMEEDGYHIGQTVLPKKVDFVYPEIPYDNDFGVMKFKDAYHHPDFKVQCRVFPIPVNDNPEDERVSFAVFSGCRDKDNYLFEPVMEGNFPDNCKIALTRMGEIFLRDAEVFPSVMEVGDGLSKAVLKDFCQKCNIKLKEVPSEKLGMDEEISRILMMTFGMMGI